MTSAEIIGRVLASVDGIEVNASHRETYLTILHAAVSLAGIAIMRFDGPERDALLEELEGRVRRYIAAVEARRALSPQASPYPRITH